MIKRQKGLTLIEVIVTVAIVGILAGVAWPVYEETARRSKRHGGMKVLLLAQAHLDKCYSKFRDYTNAGCNLPASITNPPAAENIHYYVANVAADFVRNAETYSLTITARDGQLNDTDCRTFTITNSGQRTSLDSTLADSTARCWPQ